MTGGEENLDSELMREWFDATGSVVMGRMMYDAGEEFWGDNPPFRTPCPPSSETGCGSSRVWAPCGATSNPSAWSARPSPPT